MKLITNRIAEMTTDLSGKSLRELGELEFNNSGNLLYGRRYDLIGRILTYEEVEERREEVARMRLAKPAKNWYQKIIRHFR